MNKFGYKRQMRFWSGIIPLTFALLFVLMSLIGSGAVASDPKDISMIADLLADRDLDGRLDRLGEKVTVRGRATVSANVLNGQYLMLYLQDSTAGIMIFSETLDASVAKGDNLQVTGILKLHASKPEIIVEDLKVFKSERRIPDPKPLSQVFKDPESFRGQLVSGEAVVQSKDPAKDIKMLRISPTSGSNDSLHIFVSRSNIHYEDFNFDTLEAGDHIHIWGILIRYISDFDDKVYYQVLPRSRGDLTIHNLQPTVKERSVIYADIDTTSGMIYMLLENGLWGYNLSHNKWGFLDAPGDTNGTFSTYEFGFMHPYKVGKPNKQPSPLYLPDEHMWFLPIVNSKSQDNPVYFKAVHLPSERVRGTVSPGVGRSNNFMPTHYFYNPNAEEVLFVGFDNLANTDTYPMRIHRMPADSLVSKISEPPFYLSANLYYYLMGIAVIGGVLFWFYRDPADTEKAEESERATIAFQSLLQAPWYNRQQKKLLKYMYEQDRFLESQEIEGLLWSDTESYDYRRRLRNDILKDINAKFKKHYPGMGNLILRKKDPSDNRRYLYGLNKQLMEK